jgi:hypothetical protein
MPITSTTLPLRSQVSPANTEGETIERAAVICLEAA